MAVTTNSEKLPDKVIEDLAKLLERTGMGVSQENGQRRLGLPRDVSDVDLPAKGTEVFVGKLPRDCFEPELVEIFEKVGKIYELRLMMDFSGTNRGFCFVQFYKTDEAQRAIRELNNYEIRKGRYIGVVKSVDNCRLFVGGIPTDKSQQDIYEEIKKVTDEVVRVIMYPSAADKTKNRGFSFVEYSSHKAAAMARRKMIPGKILMWGVEVAVDWAEPEPDVDSDIMGKVQVLYVRNLMLITTEELLLELFNLNSSNGVEKVKKLKDFAFVHFASRIQAEEAKSVLNNTEIDGSLVEITWAKPVDKTVYKAQKALSRTLYPPTSGRRQGTPRCNPSSSTGHSHTGEGGTYNGVYSMQSHGLMPLPTSFHNHMSPMASAGYMQYPGMYNANIRAQRMLATRFNRGRAAAGVQGIRLPGGNQSIIQHPQNHVARNIFPVYGTHVYPDHYYYAAYHQGQFQSPAVSMLPATLIKKTPQDLSELCSRNGWSEPIYARNSFTDDIHGNIYHIFTVTIPRHAPFGIKEYRGESFCQDIDEARSIAADGMYRSLQNELNIYAGQAPRANMSHYTPFAI